MNELNPALYLVSVPIGNLGDMTPRALETLLNVDYILAEDTREMVKLLHLLTQEKFPPVYSYRDQIHGRIVNKVILDINSGQRVALASDRGTPTISDPGYLLVRDVLAANLNVEAVPGVSAVVTALTLSGLPTDRFTFLGFLPRTPGKQKKLLRNFADLETTLIMYESPFRVVKLLEAIQQELGDEVKVAVCRELTKLNQEVLRGTVATVLEELKSRKLLQGEFVVCLRIN